MTARDRRKSMYQKISHARQADPQIYVRKASDPDTVARQAYQSSRIEGCNVDLKRLRETAGALAKARK